MGVQSNGHILSGVWPFDIPPPTRQLLLDADLPREAEPHWDIYAAGNWQARFPSRLE
jgi:hypothetical protein